MSDTPIFDALEIPVDGPLNATKKLAPPALSSSFGQEDDDA